MAAGSIVRCVFGDDLPGHPAQRLGPLLALALEPAPRPVARVDRLWIVDGPLIPVRDRTVGASSRNYRFAANVQVVIDAGTRPVVASARPAAAAGTPVVADSSYLGTGLIVPHRRRAGRPLLRGR